MKLGRLPKPATARHLHLADHLASPLPKAMPTWDGTPGAVVKMYGNNVRGDCVLAAILNGASVQAACEGNPGVSFDEAEAVALYDRLSPGDEGLVEVDILQLARGGILGHKVPHFAGIDFTSWQAVKDAACEFSGLLIGVDLPPDFRDQFDAGVFDVSKPGDPSLGHALAVVGYDDIGPNIATWGRVIPATWTWWEAYVREAYVLLDEARAAASIDWQGLVEAASELARQSGAGG